MKLKSKHTSLHKEGISIETVAEYETKIIIYTIYYKNAMMNIL